MSIPNEILERWAKNWPPLLHRRDALAWSYGIFKPDTLRAYEARTGEPRSYSFNKKIVYDKDEFLAWVLKRYGTAVKEHSGEVQGSSSTEEGTGGASEETES